MDLVAPEPGIRFRDIVSVATGTRLGIYEILAPLGAGGMGEVYKARDTRLGREAAIKLLPPETSADPVRRQRFEHEARAASALNHPNIITIYDIGSADGTTYIAMELVDGRTLRELIASEPLRVPRLLDIAVQAADGLAKAHAAGIVHRDLKPENLMVTRDGYVKILDFGLAKLIEPISDEDSALPTMAASPTQPGTVMGTAGYMSPEQASGQPVDFRSDQFTFGAILYEMATGVRAFRRQTGPETLVAIIREDPQPLAQLNPNAPAPMRWIIERCLAKDPEERYASTKDLARDLRSVRDHLSETSVSRAVEAAEPARLPRRGWLLPAAIAILVGGAAALVVERATGIGRPVPPQFQRLTFRRGTISSARFAPDGNFVIYGAAWEGNPLEIFSTRPESPESASLGFPSGDVLAVSSAGELAVALGRHFTLGWQSLGTLARVSLSGSSPREVLDQVQEADWSPDGKELAVVHQVADRHRLEYPIGKTLYETSGWLSHPRVSRDANRVAFFEHPIRGDNDGRLMLVGSEKPRELDQVTGAAGLAWSADGKEIWYSARGLQSANPSGKIRLVARFPGGAVLEDIFRDGRVLFKRTSWRREIVGLAPGEARERNLSWLDWSFPADLSSDGKFLLFDEQAEGAAPRGGYLSYLRKTDGSPPVLLGQLRALALSPDGKWALTMPPGGGSQLTLTPTGSGQPKTLPRTNLVYQWATFFPDGRRILATANEAGHGVRLYVQEIEGAKPPRPISPEGLSAFFKPISPDGRIVAAIGPDREIVLCPTDGGPPHPLPGGVADELPIAWTGDGRSLYVSRWTMPARIDLCDVATGKRSLWKELVPPDPAGVLAIGPIRITPDGKSYVYSYRRTLEDLYVATGLR